LKEPQDFKTREGTDKSSVQILVAVDGCGTIETPGTEPVTLAKGDAVVVPASIGDFHFRPQWTLELLKAALPGRAVQEPATRI
jgi:mannose-6-phosphate isomerase class I